MISDSPVFRGDFETILNDAGLPWEDLKGKTLLVTGGTGLIGKTLVGALLSADAMKHLSLKVILIVRSVKKAEAIFRGMPGNAPVFLEGSMEHLPAVDGKIDYIIHGASETASSAFLNQPAETIRTAVGGTQALLALAAEKKVSGFVYLSSMEVYGYPEKGTAVTEEKVGSFDPLKVRSCYPLSKILCENLCVSYAHEYGVPAKIIRLTQTFGPGVSYADGRVFAEFARCAIEGRNITLKTRGLTERSYLYTADAAAAILFVLLKGKNGAAYSAANENTYCSIAEMAALVAGTYGIDVRYELQDAEKLGYAGTLYMKLDTGALKALGFRAATDLPAMFGRMIEEMKTDRKADG